MFDYRHAVIYQIWPRSFYDSNNDGIGDLKGILAKLDELVELGIDAIWLSPVYASPNEDYGYDISDYYSIQPEYGTMEDLKDLIQQAKARNIQILMDLVANHTSTQHPWFKEALKDPSSPYRDYYIFKKGTKDTPPNNWLSFFGTSAWQKVEGDMWVLTLYTSTQADLNWQNPKVREEIVNMMRFYLDMGIAGFRMDTINTISKADGLPDKDPEKPGYQFPGDLILDRSEVKTWMHQLRTEALAPYDAFALAEAVMVTPRSAALYAGGKDPDCDMVFHFDLATLGDGELGKYDCRKLYRITPKMIKDVTRKWMNASQKDNFWIGNYLSNHDHKRHLDRFGDDGKYRAVSAKMLALYNFTLIGTPFIYQGEEIAMTNPKLTKKDWRDYETFHSSKAMTTILHIPPMIAERISSFVTRDNARTPVQWSSAPYCGFSTVEPWITWNKKDTAWNLEDEKKDPDSVYHFYQDLIRFRKEHEVLVDGTWSELCPDHPGVLAYVRENEQERLLVLLNLTRIKQNVELGHVKTGSLPLLSNSSPRELRGRMMLRPYEACIYSL